MTDKKVLTVQDISCYGQCSLTVALPIISACGVEAAILPSAVLSTHTAFPAGYTFRDLTEDLPGITEHWKKIGVFFDAILTGYLGSLQQIDIVKEMLRSSLKEGALKIIDPAMADNGRLYTGFDQTFADAMGTLCGCGDVVLPNITEACLMTHIPYRSIHDEAYIISLVDGMRNLGAKNVVLKGVDIGDGKLGVAVREEKKDKNDYYFLKKQENSCHGTGDCYAAAFTGAIMQGRSIFEAAGLAADFVVESLKRTAGDDSHWYGVKFERTLPMLVNSLNN